MGHEDGLLGVKRELLTMTAARCFACLIGEG
jgi:hypothetical protein